MFVGLNNLIATACLSSIVSMTPPDSSLYFLTRALNTQFLNRKNMTMIHILDVGRGVESLVENNLVEALFKV